MTPAWRAAPGGGAGELLVHPPIGGAGVAAREISVLLPPGYAPGGKHPVVYLQDGQNLFDPAIALAGGWRVPQAVSGLVAAGLRPVVVGIPSAGARRFHEYSPFRDPDLGGGGAADYLRFLLGRVRPLVERSFAVDRSASARLLGGSSLGAHFALWGFFAAPREFGGALAMSPTTRFAGESLLAFLERTAFVPGRIWLDCGSEEGRRRRRRRTGGGPRAPTAYVRRVRRLRRALERLGYVDGETLRYFEEPGGHHHEPAWARRLPAALAWLLAP